MLLGATIVTMLTQISSFLINLRPTVWYKITHYWLHFWARKRLSGSKNLKSYRNRKYEGSADLYVIEKEEQTNGGKTCLWGYSTRRRVEEKFREKHFKTLLKNSVLGYHLNQTHQTIVLFLLIKKVAITLYYLKDTVCF